MLLEGLSATHPPHLTAHASTRTRHTKVYHTNEE